MQRALIVMGIGLCSLMMTALPLTAAESVAGFETTPFAEGSLGDWVLENGAEADFVDGCLRLKGGNGWLRSPHEYRDFELHLEWQALQNTKYDAGIYIRTANGGAPFPKASYQVNLLEGKEGNIGNLPGAMSTGLAKPAGQWNVFDLKVVGDRVALKINGEAAYDVGGLTRLQGYVGFQIEVPLGGQFLVRNVRLKELGFDSLFNGRDLAGWSGAESPADACWSVVDGLLVCDGKKGPWLRTAQEYGDFNLRFDYLVSEGGNSGVYVRVPSDGLHHRENDTLPPAGFEVQLLDDADPKYAQLKPYQYSASVYDISGADPRVTRPAGQWNSLEINCRGQRVRTIHNGQVVVDITADSHPLLALRKTSGYLGLQNHSTVVKFRNLRIGPALE
ncbi:DUF1080 domain-containing protein [bacterium]|nr:DUF1080 domain-containing protein [bacterium]